MRKQKKTQYMYQKGKTSHYKSLRDDTAVGILELVDKDFKMTIIHIFINKRLIFIFCLFSTSQFKKIFNQVQRYERLAENKAEKQISIHRLNE